MTMLKHLNGKKLVFDLIHLKPLPRILLYLEGSREITLEKALIYGCHGSLFRPLQSP